jgi:hypothetical protein
MATPAHLVVAQRECPSPSMMASTARVFARRANRLSRNGAIQTGSPRRSPPDRGRNTVRQKTHFSNRFNRITPVQSAREKYLAFVFSEIAVLCRHPASHEGRFAVVTKRRVRDAVGASPCSMMFHADERGDAHGQVAWS